MKPLRNYFGESESNHSFNKAFKRKSSNEFSEVIANYQKLFSDVKKMDMKYEKIPTMEQIDQLKSHFIPNEIKNSFITHNSLVKTLMSIQTEINKCVDVTNQYHRDMDKNYLSKIEFEIKSKEFQAKIDEMYSMLDEITMMISSVKMSIDRNNDTISNINKTIGSNHTNIITLLDSHKIEEKKYVDDRIEDLNKKIIESMKHTNKTVVHSGNENKGLDKGIEFSKSFDIIGAGTNYIQPPSIVRNPVISMSDLLNSKKL